MSESLDLFRTMGQSHVVPDGLITMLEGLSRTVIKKKPQDINLFALYYFAKLKEFRQDNPDFGIKKLVKEFHNGTAEKLLAIDLMEELKKMGYLTTEVKNAEQTTCFDQTASSDQFAIEIDIRLSQKKESSEEQGSSDVSSASKCTIMKQSLHAVSAGSGARPKTSNASLPSNNQKSLTLMKDVVQTVTQTTSNGSDISEQMAARKIATLSAPPAFPPATEGAPMRIKVHKAEHMDGPSVTPTQPQVTTPEMMFVEPACMKASAGPEFNQTSTNIPLRGQWNQFLPFSKSSPVVSQPLPTATQDDATNKDHIGTGPPRVEGECIQPPDLNHHGVFAQPAHPMTQFPYWNGRAYCPYEQHAYYPCYHYYHHHAYLHPSLNRCGGGAQPSQYSVGDRNLGGAPSSFSAFPLAPPYPMAPAPCICRPHPPMFPMPLSPRLAVPHSPSAQTQTQKTPQFEQTAAPISSSSPSRDVKVPPPPVLPMYMPIPQYRFFIHQSSPAHRPPPTVPPQRPQGPSYPAGLAPGVAMVSPYQAFTHQQSNVAK